MAFERDLGRCIVCNGPAANVHHRQGRRIRDPHRLSNLLSCCGSGTTGCHEAIHSHRFPVYDYGWKVRKHGIATPETAPVKLFGRGFVYLTNEGEIVPVKEST